MANYKIRINQLCHRDAEDQEHLAALGNDILEAVASGYNTQSDVASYLRETGRWVLGNAGEMLHYYELCGFTLEHKGRAIYVTL